MIHWKSIHHAPRTDHTEILLLADSGYVIGRRKYIINGIFAKDTWCDMQKNRLDDMGIYPTHYADQLPLPTENTCGVPDCNTHKGENT